MRRESPTGVCAHGASAHEHDAGDVDHALLATDVHLRRRDELDEPHARGPNMSRDCTWTFSMKSFGSALILTNQSLKTCASSTFVRSMPGSAVTGTATASPESPSICTVASAIVRERQDSARARSQLQVALILGDRLAMDDDTSMCP